jgi:phosphatidylglycerol:prolipoprotein diacylglycerol transferase
MFYHNINPVLLQFGPLSIRYYGLFYALGVLFVYLALWYGAKHKLVKNLTTKNYDIIFLWMVVSCVVGARLFQVLFYEPLFYLTHPQEIIAIWHGGLSFHGALIGVAVASYFLCRKYKIRFFALADLLVIPVAFGLFLGRIGNFMNGELVGTVTNSSFCVDYSKSQYLSNPPEDCRYFSQFFESSKNLFIGFVLFFMYNSKKFGEGVIFFSFVFLYGFLRFITNFYREDIRYLGLSEGQYLSLVMVIVAVVWFVINRHSFKNSK